MASAFEYLTVRAGGTGFTGATLKAHYLNDEEIANWKDGPNLSTYLNQLGEQGWQMVAVVSMGVFGIVHYFKREKTRSESSE